MMRRLVVAALFFGAALSLSADLFACGDKFLITSRGTRFQRTAVPRTPASILVFANPASNLPKALAKVPVDATLRKAGYSPTTVTSASDFDAALSRGGWDLVLVDVADSPAIGSRSHGNTTPIIVPVAYHVTGQQWAQVRKQYPSVLKSPIRSQSFLDAIDDALAARPKPSVKGSGKSGN
jgi:hypothetical protein